MDDDALADWLDALHGELFEEETADTVEEEEEDPSE